LSRTVLQWPHRVCVGPAWLDRVSKKPSVKADLLMYLQQLCYYV